MIHEIKVYPRFFAALVDGSKPFEVRKNDRGYKVGDECMCREFHPVKGYSGQSLLMRVTYVLPGGDFGIDPDYCVLGLKKAYGGELHILYPDTEAARLVREAKVLKEASEQLLEKAEFMTREKGEEQCLKRHHKQESKKN
jgi:hypothetical protein